MQKLEDSERSILLFQLMQLRNASLHLVNTIISTNPSNDDSIILVLGALGRNSGLNIQKLIVDELLRRLYAAATLINSTESLITLTYALGNSGSKLAINALLSNLHHEDIDVKISAIRSLGYHLNQPVVQDGFMTSLALTNEDKILEEILITLTDAFDNKILINPNKKLLNATMNCTLNLENPNLYELLTKYLQQVDTEGVEVYLNLLKQQYNYGDVKHEHISDINGVDSRIKRGSDWDQYYSDYDAIASYSQRRDDVTNYPHHKAYIWAKSYGVDKFNLKVGAGAFIGAYYNNNVNKGFKVFVKGIAKVNIFGKTFNIARLEYSDRTIGNSLYHRVYVKMGWKVVDNINELHHFQADSCDDSSTILWNSGDYTVFNFKFGIFVFVGIINVYISGTVNSHADLEICACPSTLSACGNVKPSLTLRVSGEARASFLVSHKSSIT